MLLNLTSVYGRWPLTHRHYEVSLYLRTIPPEYMYSSHCAQVLNDTAILLTSVYGRCTLAGADLDADALPEIQDF